MTFNQKILSWYNKNKVEFPWRTTDDPYKIWVSEIMLQQTQVTTVIPYYNKWIVKFPTLNDVAKASDEDLFKYWEGLGYYNRVNNFRIACNEVIEKFNGKVPSSKTDLMQLKGIGDYTSSAIASIAFNKKNYVIDGNVKRIMSRVLCLKDYSKASMNRLSEFLLENMPLKKPGDFNQGLMDLGRNICKPRNPECNSCPIESSCQANLTKSIQLYPTPKPKSKKNPHYTVGIGIIWKDNEILITKRKKNTLLGGLWEFPGGKKKTNETIKACIKREILEELEIDVEVLNFLTSVEHKYSHFSITLHAYNCSFNKGKIKCNSADDWKWIKPNQLKSLPFPKANHYIFPYILDKGVA